MTEFGQARFQGGTPGVAFNAVMGLMAWFRSGMAALRRRVSCNPSALSGGGVYGGGAKARTREQALTDASGLWLSTRFPRRSLDAASAEQTPGSCSAKRHGGTVAGCICAASITVSVGFPRRAFCFFHGRISARAGNIWRRAFSLSLPRRYRLRLRRHPALRQACWARNGNHAERNRVAGACSCPAAVMKERGCATWRGEAVQVSFTF